MTTFEIFDKVTGNKITEYRTEGDAFEIAGYPMTDYNYIESQPAVDAIPTQPTVDKTSYLIDIGPFYDRFGSAKMDVLMSKNDYVVAILEDVKVRKYINLNRAEVHQAVNTIASAVPTVTADIVANVLSIPVTPSENAALRSMNYDLSGE